MAIEKKSLIGNRATVKKAVLATSAAPEKAKMTTANPKFGGTPRPKFGGTPRPKFGRIDAKFNVKG